MRSTDWDKLEVEYVTADPPISHEQMAAKHGLVRSTVGRQASARGWTAKRNEYRNRVATAAQSEIQERQVDWRVQEIERIDHLLQILADGAYQLTARAAISDVDRLVRLKAFLLGEADSRTELRGEVADVSAREQLANLLAGMRARGEAAADTGDAD
jgi:hypothetical protein